MPLGLKHALDLYPAVPLGIQAVPHKSQEVAKPERGLASMDDELEIRSLQFSTLTES